MSNLSTPPAVSPPAASAAPKPVPASPGASGQGGSDATPRDGGAQSAPRETPAPTGRDPAVVLSASLAHIAKGARLDGVIAGREADGRLRLLTEAGVFLLESAANLPAHARLSLQVLAADSLIKAVLLTRDGQTLRHPPEVQLTLTTLTGAPASSTPATAETLKASALAALALSAGREITATVISTEADGRVVFKTDAGLFLANSNENFTPGERLTFRIITTETTVRATLVARNGQPVTTPREIRLIPLPTTTLPDRPGPEPPPDRPPPERLPPEKLPDGQGAVRRESNTPLIYGPARPTASGAPALPAPSITPSGLIAGTRLEAIVLSAPVNPASANSAIPEALPVGARLSLVVTEGDAPPDGRLVRGTVSAEIGAPDTSRGRYSLLVDTPRGLLHVRAPAPLSIGTPVSLQITASAPPPSPGGATAMPPLPPPASLLDDDGALDDARLSRLHRWPALDETLAVLRQIDPALSQQIMTSLIPAPGARLSTTLAFFLAALRAGDLRGWLGDQAADTLTRAGHTPLLHQLRDEFSALARLAGDGRANEWRPVNLPFYDGQTTQTLTFFLRQQQAEAEGEHPQDSGQGGARKGDVRFVLDLDLSALGRLQLDGLVKTRRFDLIIRSAARLDDGLRQQIDSLFSRSLDASGLDGAVRFDVGAPFPVNPAASRRRQKTAVRPGVVV